MSAAIPGHDEIIMIPKKSTTKKKTRRRTDTVPEQPPRVPLDGTSWHGYDGALWVDLAVDSSGRNVALWLRKRVDSGQFFLIASCALGNVMKKEVEAEEARRLYTLLPDRGPFDDCWPKDKKVDKEQ